MIKKDFNWPAFRELTVGMGGMGKTTQFLERLGTQKAPYYFIFDHKHEIGKKLGKRYCLNRAAVYDAVAKGGYIVYDPADDFPGEKLKAFTWFCDFVYQAAQELPGRKILCTDELDQLHTKNKRPRELMLCLSDARYFKLDFIGIGQATNSLHNEVRGQMTGIFTFRQNEENAIKDLRDRGFVDSEIRALQPGEWIYHNINSPGSVKGGSAFQIKSTSIAGVVPSRGGEQLEDGGAKNGRVLADGREARRKNHGKNQNANSRHGHRANNDKISH